MTAAQAPDRVPEAVLWRNAATIVTPLFPDDALKAGVVGVGVCEIIGDAGGAVSSVRVLQAPTPSLKLAMINALRQWTFKPADGKGDATHFTGKITFYFVAEHGTGRVFRPENAPYIGRWPQR